MGFYYTCVFMIRVFKNWHTESDAGKEVELLDFLGYTRHNGYPVTYTDKDTQQKYYGAQYMALHNGNYITVTIKEFIDDEDAENEVPWSYNKNPIRDDIPYYHNDSDEELVAGKIFLSNREKINPRLARAIEESNEFKASLISYINSKLIKPTLKKGFTLYLFFYNSPSYATRKAFKSWCSINQEDYKTFKKILNWD